MRTPKLELGNPNGSLRNEGDHARIRTEFLGPEDYNASCKVTSLAEFVGIQFISKVLQIQKWTAGQPKTSCIRLPITCFVW